MTFEFVSILVFHSDNGTTMTAEGDAQGLEHPLALFCDTVASLSTPLAFHSRPNSFVAMCNANMQSEDGNTHKDTLTPSCIWAKKKEVINEIITTPTEALVTVVEEKTSWTAPQWQSNM